MGIERRLARCSMAAVGLLWLCLAIAAGVRSHQEASPSTSERNAVALLRIINTAESKYQATSGAFADWDQLSRSRIPEALMNEKAEQIKALGKVPPPLPLDVGAPQPLSGYSLSLYKSVDQAHYVCSLRPTANPDPCAASFYTSDDGLIQWAKTIGCK